MKKQGRKQRITTYEWPPGTIDGSLVQYYDDGWRAGYIVGVDKQGAKIKRIGPGAVYAHIAIDDVRLVKPQAEAHAQRRR